MKIALIDYGMGNLRSVANAFQIIGFPADLIRDPAELTNADAVVLPGVGAFGDGMANLRTMGFLDALRTEVFEKGKPFLGICLGMQFLATTGLEHGSFIGLNQIHGIVDKLPSASALRIPHIGWNDVRFTKKDGLFEGMGDSQNFYFVHSYALKPENATVVSGVCSYGQDFVASIETGKICATQFHPEKSQKAGLQVLTNFVKRYVQC